MCTGYKHHNVLLLLLMPALCLFGSLPGRAQDPSRTRVAPSPTPPAVVVTQATPAIIPPTSGQTLSDLQARIAGRLSRPEVRRGQIGVKIVGLNSGKVIFEQNGEKYLMPASNMKNFTVAAALEKL